MLVQAEIEIFCCYATGLPFLITERSLALIRHYFTFNISLEIKRYFFQVGRRHFRGPGEREAAKLKLKF